MDKKTSALKLALDALDCIYSPLHVREINNVGAAMSAIREALAEQPAQQEPVAWGKPTDEMVQAATDEYDEWANENKGTTECIRAMLSKALKASPPAPRKPFVGLTEDDLNTDMFSITSLGSCDIATIKSIAKDVEDKLREKNDTN